MKKNCTNSHKKESFFVAVGAIFFTAPLFHVSIFFSFSFCEMFLMKKKKRINNRLMHVLLYIWKHLSVSNTMCLRRTVSQSTHVDVLQSLTRNKRSLTSSSDQTKASLNVPASSSCKHAPIALSEDDRIGYYPQTFRFVFTSSSCKRGLSYSLTLLFFVFSPFLSQKLKIYPL